MFGYLLGDSNKYSKHMFLPSIKYNIFELFPLKQKFCDSQIVIITNFVGVSSVDIKRAVCTAHNNFTTEHINVTTAHNMLLPRIIM